MSRAQTIRRYIGLQTDEGLKEILEMLLDEIELLEARVAELENPTETEPEE